MKDMKQKWIRSWQRYRVFLGAMLMAGFWSFLYPEYTLLPETYRIVYTDGETEEESGEESEEETEEDIYLLLQKASPKPIRFRSKLWEFLCSLKKG